MGFFKNLIKGKFKKIGQNAVSNIASGQLIKGGGIIGSVINKATNKWVAPISTVLGGHKAIKHVPYQLPFQQIGMNANTGVMGGKPIYTAPQKVAQSRAVTKAVEAGEISPTEGSKILIDINKDGKDDTLMIVLAAAAAWFFLIKKK